MSFGILYAHGWGFDNYFWTGIKQSFSNYHSCYFSVDYFENAEESSNHLNLKGYSSKLHLQKWLAICHSYGLARFIRHYVNDENWQQNVVGLVSIAGFLKFTKSENNPYGVETLILNKMIKKFRQQPLEVLHDFHRQCEFNNPHYQNTKLINEKAYNDLKDLMTVNENHNAKKVEVPILILAAQNDSIVSKEISSSLSQMFNKSSLVLRKDGGHGLGFNHSNWCTQQIAQFMKGLNRHG